MGNQIDLIKDLASKYKYRPYMVERYLTIFGSNQIKAFLEGNEQKILPSIKVNTLKITSDALSNRLTEKGFMLEPVPFVSDAYFVKKTPFSLGATTEYLLGYYYLQGAASMLPVDLLNPSPKDLVVDMCAAPGGKTIQLAQYMENEGVIIALDLSRERMKSLRSNLSRCGIHNTLTIRMDAARLADLHLTDITKILLDAPCSGSGLISTDPSRKQSRSYDDVRFCSSIQMKLIRAAVNCLVEGGELIYSTCSIEPEENEFIIDAILKQRPLEIVDLEIPFGESGLINIFGRELSEELKKAKRFYPFLHKTVGFFVCKLRKVN
ncbi:MAG: NOL1/NOP2/sun family putative RNA methylase [Candidatus Helarchaeota archaeon]